MCRLYDGTKEACRQLMVNGGMYNSAILDVLNALVEVNESMYNDVDMPVLVQNIRVLVNNTFKVVEGY